MDCRRTGRKQDTHPVDMLFRRVLTDKTVAPPSDGWQRLMKVLPENNSAEPGFADSFVSKALRALLVVVLLALGGSEQLMLEDLPNTTLEEVSVPDDSASFAEALYTDAHRCTPKVDLLDAVPHNLYQANNPTTTKDDTQAAAALHWAEPTSVEQFTATEKLSDTADWAEREPYLLDPDHSQPLPTHVRITIKLSKEQEQQAIHADSQQRAIRGWHIVMPDKVQHWLNRALYYKGGIGR